LSVCNEFFVLSHTFITSKKTPITFFKRTSQLTFIASTGGKPTSSLVFTSLSRN